jgi:hypothetical protein
MGAGFAGEQARLIGSNYQLIAGKGTTQVGAAVLTSKNCELNPSGGNTAFILPANAGINETYAPVNNQATAGTIWVPVGQFLNGTQNGNVTVSNSSAVFLWQYKPNNWTTK